MSEAPPTLREELDRKAVDALEKLESDLQSERITLAQYVYAVDLCWTAWAGLVSRDVLSMLEIMGEKKADFVLKQHLYRGDGALSIISYSTRQEKVMVELMKPGEVPDVREFDCQHQPNPQQAGRSLTKKVIASMEARGFIPV